MDCIFCKIAQGEIPSNKLYEDGEILAFYDLDPQAPTHFLAIPKAHISGMAGIDAGNSGVIAHIYERIAALAVELKLDKGFRVVCNCGEEGGQTVGHLHFHVLAGRNLSWPPG